jgi:hypothetical protein
MFDGETSPGLDLSAGVVVLDLSRLYASPALGLLMVCALSWLQSTLAVGSGTKRLVVLDEAWALLSHLATARWLQATFKLSRSYGVANVAVVHRLSDLKAAGQEGSEQQRLAEGLLADAETRVVFGQHRERQSGPASCSACPATSRPCCASSQGALRCGESARARSSLSTSYARRNWRSPTPTVLCGSGQSK